MSSPTPNRPREKNSAPNLNAVTTIRSDGSRPFQFPSDAPGRFNTARIWVSVVLITIYIILPWVKIGGFPAVFLDVAQRRFHLFGFTLAAQDMWLMFFLITGLGFTLFFVTSMLGRIWCGWACPHSVFLDQVYRRIERWIDGDALARRKLDAALWDGNKIARRLLKHSLYLLVSAAIAHFFLAYFISLPELWRVMHASPLENWSMFAFMMIATGILYFNFAWFREQLCIVICPYGRLQSVLIDDNTMVIGYDKNRGEPRGKLGTTGAGDCVDCNRCVQVCPTGIDIRQGLQLECIGCSACIDACDDVMAKTKRPQGLIRYDSMAQLAGGKTRWLRPRTVIYGVLLCIGITVTLLNFSLVKPANFAVTRMVGTPYVVEPDQLRNLFMVRLVNKQSEPAKLRVELSGAVNVKQDGLEEAIEVPAMTEVVRALVVTQSRAQYNGTFNFELVLKDQAGTFEIRRKVQFLGPSAKLLKEDDLEKGIKR